MIGYRFKKIIRILMSISLIPMIAIGSTIYQSYESLYEAKATYNSNIADIKDTEWAAITTILDENSDKAHVQANNVERNLRKDLLLAYDGNLDQLKIDIRSNSTSAARSIISKEISHRYMNIQSDDNRMVVATEDRVFADNSITASLGKESRSWGEEIASKSNKQLANSSIKIILSRQGQGTFIESSEYHNSHNGDKEIIYPSMDSLKDEFYSNGILVLKSYNMLVPAYLTDEGDIFGTPDIGVDGLKADNDKLIIIQRFNMFDAVAQHQELFAKFYHGIRQCNKELERQISDIMVRLVLNLTIMVLAFIGLICSAVICLNWGDEGDAGRRSNS